MQPTNVQADYPVLSDDWNKMAEQIGRIGDITEMVGCCCIALCTVVSESCRLTANSRTRPACILLLETGALTAQAAGRDAVGVRGDRVEVRRSGKSTSIDGAKCSVLLFGCRYLLEDGKLNLCLRNLVDYNDYLKRMIERGPIKVRLRYFTDTELLRLMAHSLAQDSTMELMQKFERGMGLTLKNAWLHAEAVQVRFRFSAPCALAHTHDAPVVQTTDIPLLIEYIHSIFSYCLENPDVRTRTTRNRFSA